MEMHQVRYFLAVARLLNFTRAAEECHVAQPSLTRAIKQLEEEFGGELFRRERNLTHLSELGQRMLPLMQQCFDSAQTAKQVASSMRKGNIAPLAIALPITVNIELILPMLTELVRAFPGLTLKFVRGTSADVLEHLKKGDADVAFAPKLPDEWDRIESWPLFTERYRLAVAPDHPFASRGQAIAPADLTKERVFCRPYCEDFVEGMSRLASAGVESDRFHSAGSDTDFVTLLAAGIGVGFAPQSSLSSRVALIDVENFEMSRTVYAYGVAGRQRSMAANTFLKMLRAADWSTVSPSIAA